mgnify:CR=1 FL=1
MFKIDCFQRFCNWVDPTPLDLPSIKKLSLKQFEVPPKQEIPIKLSSWNIV